MPVFVFDPALLHGPLPLGRADGFMLGCLRALDAALRERGSGSCSARATGRRVVALAEEAGADAVLLASDVGPYARARDGRYAALRDGRLEAGPSPATSSPTSGASARAPGGRTRSTRRSAAPGSGRSAASVRRAPTALPALPSEVRKGRVPSLDA